MRADTDRSPLETLTAAIAAVVGWFKAANVPGVIIGGVAVSFLGRPRTTRDVDGMVVLDNDSLMAPFLAKAAESGIVPRIPDPISFARSNRVLLLHHPASGIEVDISCGWLPFESEVIDRSIIDGMLGFDVPLPTPEDLIVMKTVANRSHDWRDIEGLIDAHPDLDTERILLWAGRFAEIMESPEVVEQLEKLLHASRVNSKAVRVPKSAPITHTAERKPARKKSAAAVPAPKKTTQNVAQKKVAKKAGTKKAGTTPKKRLRD